LVTTFSVPASTVTLPALPVLEELVLLEAMPVNFVAEVPSMNTVPATRTETFPALPDPDVKLATSPLVAIDKSPAVTVILPALFAPGRNVWARIPVVTDRDPAPFIESLPATWTLTSPSAPEPIVEAEIWPELTSDREPALTYTAPALPLLPGLACDRMPA
jgi:hypothetical protein